VCGDPRAVRWPLLIVAALVAADLNAATPDLSALEIAFSRIARGSRGRVGVALIHLESGKHFVLRGHERFPMASVVKLPIALELLKQVSEGRLTLTREVWISESDIRPCCTLSRRHRTGGVSKTAGELLELMIVESDNTAADAVLKLVGGPRIIERRLRGLGFANINVNRSEGQLLLDMAGVTSAPPPESWTLELQRRLVAEVGKDALNEGRSQYLRDERDTATPYEMALFLGRLQLGDLLPRTQTDLLLSLMARSTTGPRRIRSRLPADTVVAHKTGTTAIVINDVGVITLPPDSIIPGHLSLAVFVANGSSIAAMERTIAQLSATAFEFFTGRKAPPPPPRRRRR
jgi:beta-lactamase class A